MNPIIVDANSLIVRAIMASAMDDLKAGEVWTGGVYGALNSLRSVLTLPEVVPCGVYAFFDAGVPEFRKKLIPGYKEHRRAQRELLTEEQKARAFQQIPLARDMWELLGVNCLAYKNREADDGVGAVTRYFLEQGKTPVVVSGDKDLWQVVAWGARVWYASTKSYWVDDGNFKERVAASFKCDGVDPEHYLLFKSMVGDPSDGIEGVPGCGPKRASQLIEEALGAKSVMAHEQLEAVRAYLDAKPVKQMRKYEIEFLAHADRLKDVLRGIDLYSSFGGTKGLVKALHRPAEVKKVRFLKMCNRLSFNSVLSDPARTLKPFTQAAKESVCS